MGRFLRAAGILLLFLAVALCFAPVVVPPLLDRVYYEGPVSAHFDGRRFFNPEDRLGAGHRPSRRFMSRWMRGEGRARWPDHVEVHPGIPPARVQGQEMRVTWIGHSTVLVQSAGLNILTDPIWSDRASPFSFIGPRRVRAPGVGFEDLPKIDLVLVSHDHYDHMDLPTLKRLWDRDRPLIVTSLGNDAILRGKGIEARTADWDGSIPVYTTCPPPGRCPPLASVIVERVHHWGSRWGTDRNRALWSGFTVRLPGGNVFFAGDTGWGDGSWVAEAAAHGPYRLALIPIGAYEPREIMRGSHVNPEEAVAIFQGLGARTGIGIHWGTFQLTFEPMDGPPRRLAAALARRGLAPDRFVVTQPGRTVSIP